MKPQYLEKVIYVDDLKLVNKSLEGLKGKLEACKKLLDSRLRVNVKNKKMMVSNDKARKVTGEEKFACKVCSKIVGSNSILRQFYKHWIHK